MKCIFIFWETCPTWRAHGRAHHSKDRRMLVVTKKPRAERMQQHSCWWLDKQKLTQANKDRSLTEVHRNIS